MCGIAGILALGAEEPDIAALTACAAQLAPRGPDGYGLLARQNLALAHRRLKIIDLSEHAAQPMHDPALGLSLVFNGCIYNYRELRDELSAAGYRFFSSGDSEVILKAWHAWGAACVERFNGMFAFALFDEARNRLYLARDRLGIKPLYYTQNAAEMRFASALPALLAAGGLSLDLDPVALNYYCNFHAVVPAPYTIFKAVRKVPPATILEIDETGRCLESRYWQVAYEPNTTAGEAEWLDGLLAVMRRAVRRRMVADVPVGVLLSGGVDSSLVVGLLAGEGQNDLNTFSVGFEHAGGEHGNEFVYSDLIAETFATRHHRIEVETESRLMPALEGCFRAMSEPQVSHDAIGFYLLAEEVAKHLKVVQSGQGADEIFGGYHWYPPLAGSTDPAADYQRLFRDTDHTGYLEMIHPRFHGTDHAAHLVAEHFATPGAADPVDKALRLDSTVMLVDDPLKRVDNMTMAWALEARVPFLDHEVVEFAARIPAALKIKGGGKYILKEAARRVLPAAVIDRPKGYFPVPALKHLSGPVLERVGAVLTGPKARRRELFDAGYLERLLAAPNDDFTPLGGSRLWQLFALEYWLQLHVPEHGC